MIASFGEIKFVFSGFMFQVGGVVFEALRLVLVQRLLSSGDFKMDPLVSLYYFAPACAVTNGLFTALVELPRLTMDDIYNLGPMILLANAFVAFLLNVSGVLLVSQSLLFFQAPSLTKQFSRSAKPRPSSLPCPAS